MKKLVALLLALTMVFALAACGESGKPPFGGKTFAFPESEFVPDWSVKMKEYEKISNDIAIFEIANDAKSTQKTRKLPCGNMHSKTT